MERPGAAKGDEVELREYLRGEILEEAAFGHLSEAERDRRLALFDAAPQPDPGRRSPRLSAASGEVTPGIDEADDPTLWCESRSIHRASRAINIYVARPVGDGQLPGVLVIHDNRGLYEHYREITRRLARLGYVALAPDLLTPVGGGESYGTDEEKVAALGTLDRAEMVEDLLASLAELGSLPSVWPDRLGVVGFCFGGAMAWLVATQAPAGLAAAVSFYGLNPPLGEIPNIRAAVLGIFGELDDRVNAGIPDTEKAMVAADKLFEIEIYPGAEHGFHNDTTERYHPEAARAAWARCVDFLERHLSRGT